MPEYRFTNEAKLSVEGFIADQGYGDSLRTTEMDDGLTEYVIEFNETNNLYTFEINANGEIKITIDDSVEDAPEDEYNMVQDIRDELSRHIVRITEGGRRLRLKKTNSRSTRKRSNRSVKQRKQTKQTKQTKQRKQTRNVRKN